MEAPQGEVAELRASRRRLVQAADEDRRRIERDLHEGVQQHLIAIAVNVQLAKESAGSDPAGARVLLDEIERDVQRAVDEAARLAQWISPPLLEAAGLAAALRSAAVSVGVPASVDVATRSNWPPELARTVYLCWLETLASHGGTTRASITVREVEDVVAFEVVGGVTRSTARLEGLRERAEALGGQLTIGPEPGGAIRVSGALPLSR